MELFGTLNNLVLSPKCIYYTVTVTHTHQEMEKCWSRLKLLSKRDKKNKTNINFTQQIVVMSVIVKEE